MDKKSIFLLCCGLAVSAGLGYISGRSHEESLQKSNSPEKKSVALRVPRFGDSPSSTETASRGERIAREKETLESLLLRYRNPTHQMLEQELNQLKNTNLSSEMNIDKFFKLFYLSYKWGQKSPKQALFFTEAMRDKPMGELVKTMVMQGWSESNPEAVTAYLRENKTGMDRNPDILSVIASEYGKSSPSNAAKWFSSLDDTQKQSVLPSLLSSIAEAHPDKIKTFLYLIPSDEQKSYNLYSQLAEKWATVDWNAAHEWINTLPSREKNRTLRSALGALAKTDPEKATAEYMKLDDARKGYFADAILPGIANQSPMKALDWLFQNVPESQIPESINNALGYGPLDSTDELTERIASLPEGITRDTLIQQLLQKTTYSPENDSADFTQKLTLAFRIGDEEKRSHCIDNIISAWSYNDPTATMQWVEASSLTLEQKKKYADAYTERKAQEAAPKKMMQELPSIAP